MSKPTIKVKPGQRQCPNCSSVMGSRAKICKNPECKFKFPKKVPPPVKVKRGKRFCPQCFTILPSKKPVCGCGHKFPPKLRSNARFPPDENMVRDFVAKCGGVEEAKATIDRFAAEQKKLAAWSELFDQVEQPQARSAQQIEVDDHLRSLGFL